MISGDRARSRRTAAMIVRRTRGMELEEVDVLGRAGGHAERTPHRIALRCCRGGVSGDE